jgi:uncharacterized short protein YbdD (DUF466 family)
VSTAPNPGVYSLAAARVSIAALARRIRAAWGVVRILAGEDDYARYLEHHAAVHPDREPMSARAFYREREQRKWDGVKRCC